MKKTWKRIVTLVLAMVMMVSVLPVQASAASLDVPSTYTITRYSSKDYGMGGSTKLNKSYFTYVPGKITKFKSSDKNIVTVSKVKSGDGYSLYLTAKKKGTATVSFKYGSKTYKTKVTVLKYKNPISSVKIGSTKIKGSKFSSRANYTLKYSKFSNKNVKVTVKLKSGWTLGYEDLSDSFGYYGNGWAKSDLGFNKQKIKVEDGKGFSIDFPVTNTSTGQTEDVVIILN